MTPPNPPLRAVIVADTPKRFESHWVGKKGVTAVIWHEQPGQMAMVPTLRVFKDGKLFSEHPFHNVISVYYQREEDPQ